MKPTEKQKKIINFLIDQLKCWRDTNDINSPTHNSDMEECFENLKYDIGPINMPIFSRIVVKLFLFIKALN